MRLGLFAVLLVACNADSTPTALGGRLSISSPANNTTIPAPANHLVPVTFDTNYLLRAPGTCSGQDGCGFVALLIDNTTCNAPSQEYNALALASPTSVDLSLCKMTAGQHTISAELHYDNSSLVENTITRDPVTSTVTITVQ